MKTRLLASKPLSTITFLQTAQEPATCQFICRYSWFHDTSFQSELIHHVRNKVITKLGAHSLSGFLLICLLMSIKVVQCGTQNIQIDSKISCVNILKALSFAICKELANIVTYRFTLLDLLIGFTLSDLAFIGKRDQI